MNDFTITLIVIASIVFLVFLAFIIRLIRDNSKIAEMEKLILKLNDNYLDLASRVSKIDSYNYIEEEDDSYEM